MNIGMFVIVVNGIPVKAVKSETEADIIAECFDNAKVFPVLLEMSVDDVADIADAYDENNALHVYAEEPVFTEGECYDDGYDEEV